MEITSQREKAKVFSPFGRKTRPFTEPNSSGVDEEIGSGQTLPDLIRKYYGVTDVKPFKARFPFLDRDNKERSYSPREEDPFVFHGMGSITEFKDDAIKLINVLMARWKELGLPSKQDKDRNITVPDSEAVWTMLDSRHPDHNKVKGMKDEIMFITSNVDIMKKACIVRGVIPGWWASSYAGKNAPDLEHFMPSIRAHIKAIRLIEASPKFKTVLAKTSEDLGDPMDTNTGYPDFTAEMDTHNNPIGRLRTLERFAGMGTANYDLKKLILEVDKRSQGTGCEGFPFLIAPLRRVQPGYKWSHVFKHTSYGLTTSHDERGNNTVRIAWMSSYIYNLLLSPLQLEWKALRKMMPGLYHDGEAKKNRLNVLRKDKPWIAEADYSNYDRFIPINLFMKFTELYLSGKPNSKYWYDVCNTLHHGLPLVWPDYVGSDSGRGWAFYPSSLGLLSGVKITSEVGTFVNSIINGQGYIDAGLGNEAALTKYLSQYVNKPVGSGTEYWQIQSDDTLLQSSNPDIVFKLGNAFNANVKKAGLKSSLEFGDRFLMRHMDGGRDTPVPARVWQNTLSNEDPAVDPLKFLVGLAMRSDGILGQKTYDPFGTGMIQPCSKIEIQFTCAVLDSILRFFTSAAKPQTLAIEYVKIMLEAGNHMLVKVKGGTGSVKMNQSDATRLDLKRKAFLLALANREQELLKLAGEGMSKASMQTLLYELHKQRNVPSSKMLLDLLTYSSTTFSSALSKVAQKEHTFYLFAMNKLKIPLKL